MRTRIYEAEAFFAELLYGAHHIPRSGIKPFGEGWCIDYYGDLSTYDFDMLTRLVFLAHDQCVRVSIMQSGPRLIKIVIWKRKREGGMCEKHPTLEEALLRWNKRKNGNKQS